ncbi:recombination endonuclease subunit [Synechococcus phage DSL-LC03]|nr:recombination endonuclease subunit [Synechococcus phage DSL-LC03]
MILFKTIKWKNFLSTGNQWTEINLCKSETTLIIGTNGAGKSTVLDALTFGLFNKPFRKINKPQLINSQNDKDCVVEIELAIGNTEYKVVRGIKPTLFEIYKNGIKLPQNADVKDDQRHLEANILKLNYKSFTQIVVLGSSSFVPFMQLTAASRREVIEDLLDIKIFSSMNDVIKSKIKDTKDQLKILELKEDSIEDKIKMQESFINQLQEMGQKNIEDKQNKIGEITDQITSISSLNDNNNIELEKLIKGLEEFANPSEKLRKLGNLKGKLSQKVAIITKEHKFFNENTVCPTCTQGIDERFRLDKIADAQNKAKELQSGYVDLENAIKEEEEKERQFIALSKEVTSLTHEISQNNTKISGHEQQIKSLRSEIQDIATNIENQNIEHDKLESYQGSLIEIRNKLAKHKENVDYYDFIHTLLKDGGVKTKIIKHYLPLINQQVNKYLQMLDFYINFSLDEEFNEKIKSPIHENFSYSSFSEGEKMRIDLALLFTWREVARLKNSVNTNLLIMDEVFDSSLDGFGTDEFLKIIRYIIKDANIFVISHKSELHDKFESVIKFDKVKGFSKILV